jgi:hypothetical protein
MVYTSISKLNEIRRIIYACVFLHNKNQHNNNSLHKCKELQHVQHIIVTKELGNQEEFLLKIRRISAIIA